MVQLLDGAYDLLMELPDTVHVPRIGSIHMVDRIKLSLVDDVPLSPVGTLVVVVGSFTKFGKMGEIRYTRVMIMVGSKMGWAPANWFRSPENYFRAISP